MKKRLIIAFVFIIGILLGILANRNKEYLINAQVDSVKKFTVDNFGKIFSDYLATSSLLMTDSR